MVFAKYPKNNPMVHRSDYDVIWLINNTAIIMYGQPEISSTGALKSKTYYPIQEDER